MLRTIKMFHVKHLHRFPSSAVIARRAKPDVAIRSFPSHMGRAVLCTAEDADCHVALLLAMTVGVEGRFFFVFHVKQIHGSLLNYGNEAVIMPVYKEV